MVLEFAVTDIPPVTDPDTLPPITSDDPVCVECGVAITYGGRGRKPKYCDDHKAKPSGTSRASRSGSSDVNAAMAALTSAHTSLSFLLLLLGGDAAIVWEAQRDDLNARNRAILEADPKLAKKLATAASKGGGPALVISHMVAVAPAAGITFGKLKEGRAAKRQHPDDSPHVG